MSSRSTMRPRADGLYHVGVPAPAPVTGPMTVHNPGCWLAFHGRFENGPMPSCEGQLIRAHLIPRQKLKRELGEELAAEMIEDPRTWVPACGGITGIGGHHGAFDSARRLRVPWSEIPEELKELCRMWEKRHLWRGAYAWLEMTYRRRARPGASGGGKGDWG